MQPVWTMDTDEELNAEIASTTTPKHPASRWAKRVGIVSLLATMLLLSFAAGRASQGGSTTTSALQHGVTQNEEMTKIRRPVVEGQCTAAEGMCAASKCCATTNYYCWKKSDAESFCKETCPKGWKCTELESQDTLVPVAHDSDGTSLYCYSAYIKNRGVNDADDFSLDLLQSQIKVGTGIFACDEWRVFSDVKYGLNADGSATTVQVFGDDFHQQRRKDLGGWGANQWVNTAFYRKVWQKIASEKDDPAMAAHSYYTKSWIVKADADVVFIASRLQEKLGSIKTPKQGLYVEHCKEVEYGFFGSLEVMSKTAAVILFQNAETCYNGEVNWKASKAAQKYGWYGEDLFAQKCMDRHGVKKIWDFEMVTDGTCETDRPDGQKKNKTWVPDPETCRVRHTPAYKPLKYSTQYFACLGAITGKQYNF